MRTQERTFVPLYTNVLYEYTYTKRLILLYITKLYSRRNRSTRSTSPDVYADIYIERALTENTFSSICIYSRSYRSTRSRSSDRAISESSVPTLSSGTLRGFVTTSEGMCDLSVDKMASFLPSAPSVGTLRCSGVSDHKRP